MENIANMYRYFVSYTDGNGDMVGITLSTLEKARDQVKRIEDAGYYAEMERQTVPA